MTLNIISNNLEFFFKNYNTNFLLYILTDKISLFRLLNNTNTVLNNLSINYLTVYYHFINNLNYNYLNYVFINLNLTKNYFYFLNFYIIFIKINMIIFIIYTIFFFKYLENYFKNFIYTNSLAKLVILNEAEKEVGPVEDFLFFALLFILTISFFIFITVSIVIFHSKFYIWINASFALLAFLFLTLPINLFFDYGTSFVVYIKGSASSSNFLKELVFDIISTFTVFVRFIIQNIRFLFILLAIFELLEWVLNYTNNFFITNFINSNNFFINNNVESSNNIVIINSILFVIAYFYYFLHLLFLLLVQITIYIGISAWLFFFLYSTKFLSKYEKFFVIKKL